jgi:hypothetical protein
MTDVVRRSAELDLDAAGALRALVDPEILSTWLGRWEPDGGDGAVVTTDDGVRRLVADLRVGPDGVRWRWRPAEAPDGWSEVAIEVEQLPDQRSRVTVTEPARADTGASADGLKWSVCLLVLEVAAATAASARA